MSERSMSGLPVARRRPSRPARRRAQLRDGGHATRAVRPARTASTQKSRPTPTIRPDRRWPATTAVIGACLLGQIDQHPGPGGRGAGLVPERRSRARPVAAAAARWSAAHRTNAATRSSPRLVRACTARHGSVVVDGRLPVLQDRCRRGPVQGGALDRADLRFLRHQPGRPGARAGGAPPAHHQRRRDRTRARRDPGRDVHHRSAWPPPRVSPTIGYRLVFNVGEARPQQRPAPAPARPWAVTRWAGRPVEPRPLPVLPHAAPPGGSLARARPCPRPSPSPSPTT